MLSHLTALLCIVTADFDLKLPLKGVPHGGGRSPEESLICWASWYHRLREAQTHTCYCMSVQMAKSF